MLNYIQLLAIVSAGISVGLADILIKKFASAQDLWAIFKSPWIIAILFLYFAQIFFFAYVFSHNWKLGVAGNLQMVFYSITMIAGGFLLFRESLSAIQVVGIFLAIVAVFLINQ